MRNDSRAVLTAAGLLCVMGAGVAALFLAFWWDASCSRPFTERSPTEILQSVVLALSVAIYAWEARRRTTVRRAIVLVGGLLACMLIREQDCFLDAVSHGFWKWPAFTLAASCILYALAAPDRTLAAMARLTRTKGFLTLLTGIVIVLAYSRMFGTGILWKALLPDGGWRIAKYAAEESSELLGYLLILFSACLLRLGHGGETGDGDERRDRHEPLP